MNLTVGMGEAGLQQIRDAGVKVFVVKNAADFNETYTTIEEIGRATGKLAEAQKIVEDMKAKVEEVKEKVAKVETKKTVFVETSDVPEIYTPGKWNIHARNVRYGECRKYCGRSRRLV